MAKKITSLPPLTESQIEIMNVVWDLGEATVAQVWKELSGRRDVARNTVQTQMMRLDERGWLRHRAEGKTFYYQAAHPRDEAQRDLLQRMVDRGTGTPTAGRRDSGASLRRGVERSNEESMTARDRTWYWICALIFAFSIGMLFGKDAGIANCL